MSRYEFDLPLPPTTGAVVYRALVAGTIAAKYPKVLGLTAAAYGCRLEFFDAGLKKRDLDAMATSLLEALVKARVIKDDALIETLITSRSSIGPAGTVRVTLLELDTMTKAAVAKSFALEPWADKTLNSAPEAGSPAASLYRNPGNEAFAYLQGNTSGSGVEGSSTTRTELGRYDLAVLQWKWPDAQDEETTYLGQLRTAHPHLKLLMYTDLQFWYDADEAGSGGTHYPVWQAISTLSAPSQWRAKKGSGADLGYAWSPSNTKCVNWVNATNGSYLNSASDTLAVAMLKRVESYMQLTDYDGIMFDDSNVIANNRNTRGSGGSGDWDYDNDSTDEDFDGDAAFKSAWASGVRALVDSARTRYPTFIVCNNPNMGYWYRQSDAGGCPSRPYSGHPFYQMDDTPFCENLFSFNGLGQTESTSQTYPFLSYFSIDVICLIFELYRQTARDATVNKMGAAAFFADQKLDAGDDAANSTTYAYARMTWAWGKLFGASYGTVRTTQRPFPLDECCIDLGDRISSTSMGTLNEGSAPVTFTKRTPDFESGAADFYWAEYENALVVMRLDIDGITLGSSNFGAGTAVSCTLPSAGSGYRWDRFDCTTYVHPTVAALSMQSQDATTNSGATNVTSVSLKPMHGIALRRVATGGGGGTEVAPAFRAASSDSTDSSGQTTANVPKPTGTVSGDLVVLAALVGNNGTAGSWGSLTWPSGFTEQASITADPSGYNKLYVATKVAGGSEPSTYDIVYGFSGDEYRVVGAAVAYSAPNATPLDVSAASQNNTTSAGTVTAPSLTPSNANEKRLVNIYAISDGNVSTDGRSLAPPGGQTERVEINATSTGYTRLMIADEVYTSASATGTRSATITGGNCESMAISLLLRGKVP